MRLSRVYLARAVSIQGLPGVWTLLTEEEGILTTDGVTVVLERTDGSSLIPFSNVLSIWAKPRQVSSLLQEEKKDLTQVGSTITQEKDSQRPASRSTAAARRSAK